MRPVGDSWLESVINAFYVGSMKYSLYARIIHVSLPKPAGHIHLTVCLDLQGKLYDRVTSHADPIDVLTLPRWATFPTAFVCVWKNVRTGFRSHDLVKVKTLGCQIGVCLITLHFFLSYLFAHFCRSPKIRQVHIIYHFKRRGLVWVNRFSLVAWTTNVICFLCHFCCLQWVFPPSAVTYDPATRYPVLITHVVFHIIATLYKQD